MKMGGGGNFPDSCRVLDGHLFHMNRDFRLNLPMLDNLSNLRLILIGILACMVLALVFGAPKIVMESLTLAFATAF
jgi:hypothetical protein